MRDMMMEESLDHNGAQLQSNVVQLSEDIRRKDGGSNCTKWSLGLLMPLVWSCKSRNKATYHIIAYYDKPMQQEQRSVVIRERHY